MTDTIPDRIHLAWQLRHDIHKALKDRRGATAIELFMIFHTRNKETIRKSLQKLQRNGDVYFIGKRGHEYTYYHARDEISPESDVRMSLAESARKCLCNFAEWNNRGSKKRKSIEPDRFDIAYATRSSILEYLKKSGPAKTTEIAIALEINENSVYRSCKKMILTGELIRAGGGNLTFYAANADEAISADMLRAKASQTVLENIAKSLATMEEKAKKKEKAEPWRTVHRSGDGPPIKNQGGQGSYRFGLQSSFRMI